MPTTSSPRSQSKRIVRAELGRLFHFEERHRRLLARVLIAIGLTALVDAIGSILVWHWERGAHGSEIHGFGDAIFFVTVQILTVSSQLKNPVTTPGRIVDVFLEIWAIFVITAVAGSFSSFFSSGDSE